MTEEQQSTKGFIIIIGGGCDSAVVDDGEEGEEGRRGQCNTIPDEINFPKLKRKLRSSWCAREEEGNKNRVFMEIHGNCSRSQNRGVCVFTI
jgi:hypothetical protein